MARRKRKVVAKVKGKFFATELERCANLRQAATEILDMTISRRRELWDELKKEYQLEDHPKLTFDWKTNEIYIQD